MRLCSLSFDGVYLFMIDCHLCIVFEFMDYDLWRLMTGPNVTFDLLQIKCLVKQMLEGLYQCHSAGIMHRDVKRKYMTMGY
jgi:serine/threonine protein kinase